MDTAQGAAASAPEREAVDALLGAPASAWDGAAREQPRDLRTTTVGGPEARSRRHLLLPALQALQRRVGWISEGGLAYVCLRLGVPAAEAWGVATFYALLSTSPRPPRVVHVCDDLSCKCAGADALIAELETLAGAPLGGSHRRADANPEGRPDAIAPSGAALAGWMRSPCLGLCEHGPATLVTDAGISPSEDLAGPVTADEIVSVLNGQPPPPRAATLVHQDASTRHLLARVGRVDPSSLAAFRASGGYDALVRAIAVGPRAVIEEVMASKLVGRGGAAFPTGRKWDAVAAQEGPKYFVCNADESEPGTFKDRVLLEEDPFTIVEAMTIGAFATGCAHGVAFVRAEYSRGAARLQHAIDEARRAGLLGPDILGSGIGFDIEVRRGAGAYICGEETALFESIEGRSGFPRTKPPFPVTKGLFGRPTVVNNVETLANIPRIVLRGAAAFSSTGTAESTGTRLFCVSGRVRRPGVYEVPLGTRLGTVIDLAGGVLPGHTLRAVLLGGAAGTFIRPDGIDLPLSHEGALAAGATLGSGAIVLFDETSDLPAILRRIAAFFRDESCGQCVPCRVGVVRQEEALHRIHAERMRGDLATELALLDDVGSAMRDASICGLGQTAYAAIESAIKRLGIFEEPVR